MQTHEACGGCGRAYTDTPNDICPNIQHWRARVEMLGATGLTERQRGGLTKILVRIGSWTSSRWDQHLRWEIGDEDTDVIVAWLKSHGIEPSRGSGNFAKGLAKLRKLDLIHGFRASDELMSVVHS